MARDLVRGLNAAATLLGGVNKAKQDKLDREREEAERKFFEEQQKKMLEFAESRDTRASAAEERAAKLHENSLQRIQELQDTRDALTRLYGGEDPVVFKATRALEAEERKLEEEKLGAARKLVLEGRGDTLFEQQQADRTKTEAEAQSIRDLLGGVSPKEFDVKTKLADTARITSQKELEFNLNLPKKLEGIRDIWLFKNGIPNTDPITGKISGYSWPDGKAGLAVKQEFRSWLERQFPQVSEEMLDVVVEDEKPAPPLIKDPNKGKVKGAGEEAGSASEFGNRFLKTGIKTSPAALLTKAFGSAKRGEVERGRKKDLKAYVANLAITKPDIMTPENIKTFGALVGIDAYIPTKEELAVSGGGPPWKIDGSFYSSRDDFASEVGGTVDPSMSPADFLSIGKGAGSLLGRSFGALSRKLAPSAAKQAVRSTTPLADDILGFVGRSGDDFVPPRLPTRALPAPNQGNAFGRGSANMGFNIPSGAPINMGGPSPLALPTPRGLVPPPAAPFMGQPAQAALPALPAPGGGIAGLPVEELLRVLGVTQ